MTVSGVERATRIVPASHPPPAVVVAELFSEYKLQSAHSNMIAFAVDAGVLRRVLGGLSVSDAARVEVKLTKKSAAAPPPPPPAATPATGSRACPGGAPPPPPPPPPAAPYLEVTAQGADVHVVNGVPLLGPPLGRSAVDSLVQLVSGGSHAPPYWLRLSPSLASQLQSEVASLRVVRPTLDLATTADGDLHLYAATHALTLGTEHRGLPVAWSPGCEPQGGGGGGGGGGGAQAAATPGSAAAANGHEGGGDHPNPPQPQQQPQPQQPQPQAGSEQRTPGGRLAASRAARSASEVHVAARDLGLALSFHVTRCDCLLLGIAANGGFVEVAARFDDAGCAAPDAVALGIKLPVMDDTNMA